MEAIKVMCVNQWSVLLVVGTEVYSSDGENVGKVAKVNDKYFTTRKRGLVTDEEYRIPITAVSNIEPSYTSYALKLTLSSGQLRHGYEFLKERPNSEIVSGASQSEFKIPSEKPVLHYEALEPLEGNVSVTTSREGLSSRIEYSCDQCRAKFDDSSALQKHRGDAHKAPVGI